MIIVEGLDNTGKTTLAKRIAEEFDLPNRPSIGNQHPPAEELWKQAWDEIYGNLKVVSDRSRIISEWVYNPILKTRPTAWNLSEEFKLIETFVQTPQLIIHCLLPIRTIEGSLGEREQLKGVYENLDRLELAYERFMAMLKFFFKITGQGRVVNYDWTEGGTASYEIRVKTAVEEYLRRLS